MTVNRIKPSLRMTQPREMQRSRYDYGIVPCDGNAAWQLFCAAADGDVGEVTRLVERDPSIVNAQYWYQMPIHFAVREGHASVVEKLLNHGAEPAQSKWSYRNWDWLIREAARRQFTDVEAVLRSEMELRFNYSPLVSQMFAFTKDGDWNSVQELLDANPNLVNAGDEIGSRPLHYAALTGRCDFADNLLERGADIDAKRADGQTPLEFAINRIAWTIWADQKWVHKWVMAGFLRGRGAECNLNVAAALGDLSLMARILSGDPKAADRLDRSGRSPLMYAARSGQTEAVQLLLEHGADPNQPEFNCSPDGAALHSACGENNLEIAELLLQHGANPNAQMDSCADCIGIARYHHEGRNNRLEKLLVSHGANRAIWDYSEKELVKQALETPAVATENHCEYLGAYLHAVSETGEVAQIDNFVKQIGDSFDRATIFDPAPSTEESLKYFLGRGMDINGRNWMGETRLHQVAESGRSDEVELYVRHGADINAVDIEESTTPLGRAAKEGHRQTVQKLLTLGADPTIPDDRIWAQPVALAEAAGHASIVELLSPR